MAKSVVFVDDEPNILRGLQRTFRRMRNEWDMNFMEGGEAALKHLADTPADVIVSDMRMPGMDGAQFLTEAAKSHPGSIRIILSGEADREMTFRTIGVSHQFLPKPCNTDNLADKIQRCLAAKRELPEGDLQTAVSGITSLPVSDKAFQALKASLEGTSPSFEDAAEIVASDPGLAAKVLQLANSAYFGIGQWVNSPAEAVKLLGIDIVRPLLEKGCFLPASETAALNTAVFAHALHEAQSLAALAQKAATEAEASPVQIELAQAAGLLHNVGRMVICAKLPSCYAALDDSAAIDPAAIGQAEEQAFSCTQAAFGGYLALLWGFPDAVCSAIAHQSAPQNAPDPQDPVLLALTSASQTHSEGHNAAAA